MLPRSGDAEVGIQRAADLLHRRHRRLQQREIHAVGEGADADRPGEAPLARAGNGEIHGNVNVDVHYPLAQPNQLRLAGEPLVTVLDDQPGVGWPELSEHAVRQVSVHPEGGRLGGSGEPERPAQLPGDHLVVALEQKPEVAHGQRIDGASEVAGTGEREAPLHRHESCSAGPVECHPRQVHAAVVHDHSCAVHEPGAPGEQQAECVDGDLVARGVAAQRAPAHPAPGVVEAEHTATEPRERVDPPLGRRHQVHELEPVERDGISRALDS